MFNFQEFAEKYRNIYNKMGEDVGRHLKPPGNIKEYSQFLAEYEITKYDFELEMPGVLDICLQFMMILKNIL